ncbi:App1 family protein [Sediminicola sp. 1XM1-17]|uniref:App1 family protein n=1 Tax=Sediminicola sp. 1XM1-17 TaxID=3127702 RepID=UPI0030776BBA
MGLFRSTDPLQITVFQTYGSDTHLYIKGRALEDENIDLTKKNVIHLLINSWKRFGTDVVANCRIKLKLPNGDFHEFETDAEGYFLLALNKTNLQSMCNEEGWLAFEVSYADESIKRNIQLENRFPGEMLIPSLSSDFGVISDIDDTILHTGMMSWLKWRVLYNTFLKTPDRRIPLSGAPEFYHLLHRGAPGDKSNPIFYVSNSPWNLYLYLKFFLKNNNFPKGPILLRSLGAFFNRHKLKGPDHRPHKNHEILNILKTYPSLAFVLIGDSGEKDADIYLEIAKMYPDRIKAIYLRSVKHRKKMLRVAGLYRDYKDIPVLMVEDSDQAIQHALKNGLIVLK